jgi:hypothetical protein
MSKKFDKKSKMFYTSIMSKIFDTRGETMSYEEKITWAFLGVTTAAFLGYVLWLLSQLGSQPSQIAYVVPMLVAIGIAIVAAIAVNILISITQGTKRDERDHEIERYGGYHSQFVIELSAMAAVGMAMAKLEHFWIAHLLYVALVGDAMLSSAIKIVLYRKGFIPH